MKSLSKKEKKEYYNTQLRNKKSLSNALMMYVLLKEGGSISFSRTKDSKSTLKVLTGNRIYINDDEYSMEDFPFYSNIVCKTIKEVLNQNVTYKSDTITLTKDMLQSSSQIDKSSFKPDFKSKIDEFRAREANFSNTLAYVILKMGYSLSFKNRHLKITNSKYHFYFFDEIIDENNDVISTENKMSLLIDLVSLVKVKLKEINYITVTKKDLSIFQNNVEIGNFNLLPLSFYKIECKKVNKNSFIF